MDRGVVRVGDGRDADLVSGVGEDAGEGAGPQIEALTRIGEYGGVGLSRCACLGSEEEPDAAQVEPVRVGVQPGAGLALPADVAAHHRGHVELVRVVDRPA
ncbi:hypothetical protein [Nonomuraea sp. NPDC049028]|uniref:hypothetical protein n=1 Tax=Nonomuraea sp. NPDC049028 TaxID=3364348 RepID=UPI003711B428